MKAEKQLVVLLSMPLGSRDAVTVLSLDQYPPLMGLLSRRTHKDMALKVVQTVLAQVRCGVAQGRGGGTFTASSSRPGNCARCLGGGRTPGGAAS